MNTTVTAVEWGRRLGGPRLGYVDGRIYTDASLFQLELHRIWRRTWLLVLHESELPLPLDFRTTSVSREQVVVIRGEDGRVRAFQNVCPHRGATLVREPAGNLRTANPSGAPGRVTCMFHAWQFDARGRCVAIPRREAGYQDRLRCEDVGLRELSCQVGFGGFVFIHLDADPPPLEAALGPAFAALRPHLEAEPLEVFHHHKALVRTNYKLWHETNSEFYHDYMHHFNRVTSMQQPGYHDRHYTLHPGGHVDLSSMVVKYTAYEHEDVALAHSRDLSFPGLERNGWKMLDLFPGVAVNLRGSVLRVDTVTPLSQDQVLIEFRGLGLARDTADDRARRVRDHNTIWGPFGRNLPEDLLGVVLQGTGMPAGSPAQHVLQGREEGLAIHDEGGLRHYYAEWSRRMGRSAQDPWGEAPPTPRAPRASATGAAQGEAGEARP
jgi:methanesulfonate monooxygenase large subunit